MRKMACMAVLALVVANPVFGQSSRIYIGGTLAADSGSRGPIDVGTITTAGGILGFRLTDAWSIELQVDRGAGSRTWSHEGAWLSYAPPSSSYEEWEKTAIHARFDHTDAPRTGWSAAVAWRSREAGRVNVLLLAGLSSRHFSTRVVRTTTRVPEGIPLDHPNVQNAVETRTITGGGLTAGFAVPIRLTRGMSIAPEVRFTGGLITDESTYKILHTGLRVMWDF